MIAHQALYDLMRPYREGRGRPAEPVLDLPGRPEIDNYLESRREVEAKLLAVVRQQNEALKILLKSGTAFRFREMTRGAGMISFTVYGKPAAAGSKKGFFNKNLNRVLIVDANKNAKPWKQEVASVAAQVWKGELLTGALSVTFRFFKPRGKGHFKKDGTLSSEGKAKPFPAVKPDVLKLSRGVEDALTGVIWRDDAQIVDEHIVKNWGEPERVEIEIRELASATDQVLTTLTRKS